MFEEPTPRIDRVSMSATDLVERGMRLYAEGRLDALRDLVHPEAEIQMFFLDGDVARGPDGLARALQAAAATIHAPSATRFLALDDHAAMMVGRIRHNAERGWIDRSAVWLTVVKDGLIWRTEVFSTEDDARSAYASVYRPTLASDGQ